MTSHKKPGVVFWATVVVVVVLVGYPLSMRKACWISSRMNAGAPIVNVAYLPMMWIRDVGPEFIQDGILWYSRIGSARGWCWSGENDWMHFDDDMFGG